jgi:hypothetical protein
MPSLRVSVPVREIANRLDCYVVRERLATGRLVIADTKAASEKK